MRTINIDCEDYSSNNAKITDENGTSISEHITSLTLRLEANRLNCVSFEIQPPIIRAKVGIAEADIANLNQIKEALAAFGYSVVPTDELKNLRSFMRNYG